jgi:transposase
MLSLPSAVRILVWTQPIDMRKGFSALTTLVASVDEDPYSGHLYVFVSRRRDQLRILTWQRGGFVLLCKRLSQGVFPLPVGASARQEVDGATLAMLLEGIDVAKVKRPRHWVPASRSA